MKDPKLEQREREITKQLEEEDKELTKKIFNKLRKLERYNDNINR